MKVSTGREDLSEARSDSLEQTSGSLDNWDRLINDMSTLDNWGLLIGGEDDFDSEVIRNWNKIIEETISQEEPANDDVIETPLDNWSTIIKNQNYNDWDVLISQSETKDLDENVKEQSRSLDGNGLSQRAKENWENLRRSLGQSHSGDDVVESFRHWSKIAHHNIASKGKKKRRSKKGKARGKSHEALKQWKMMISKLETEEYTLDSKDAFRNWKKLIEECSKSNSVEEAMEHWKIILEQHYFSSTSNTAADSLLHWQMLVEGDITPFQTQSEVFKKRGCWRTIKDMIYKPASKKNARRVESKPVAIGNHAVRINVGDDEVYVSLSSSAKNNIDGTVTFFADSKETTRLSVYGDKLSKKYDVMEIKTDISTMSAAERDLVVNALQTLLVRFQLDADN